MRLNEIKKILEKVLNDEDKIHIEHEPEFGGPAQRVKNYGALIDALNIITDQPWNDFNADIMGGLEGYEKKQEQVLSQADFNSLNQYVSELNSIVHLYYGILDTMVDEQDENTINIKLPEDSLKSLEDISTINKKLIDILKVFNINGEAKFIGFDKGTDWILVSFIGGLSYQYFISCLKLAQEFFKLKKEYYKSKKAELDFRASLAKQEDFSSEKLQKYIDNRIELELEERVKEIIKNIKETNGRTNEELMAHLLTGTNRLVETLGDNVEFHLSINPPAYANEVSGSIEINYKKMQENNAKMEAKKTPQIKPASKKEGKEE